VQFSNGGRGRDERPERRRERANRRLQDFLRAAPSTTFSGFTLLTVAMVSASFVSFGVLLNG
jgi:hypothetical protein